MNDQMHLAGATNPPLKRGGASRPSVTEQADQMVEDLICRLIRLHYDHYEACQLATDHLVDDERSEVMVGLELEHARAIDELKAYARASGVEPPDSGDLGRLLTKARVQLGRLRGDSGILGAMSTNTQRLCEVYQEASERRGLPPELHTLLASGMQREHQHRIAVDRA